MGQDDYVVPGERERERERERESMSDAPCFYCDDEQVQWAIDRLGDLLDAGVPPEWILGKMTEVISLLHHPDLDVDPAQDAGTESSVELEADSLEGSVDPDGSQPSPA